MAEIRVRSELNASIWKIAVGIGDRVTAGDTLILLECMKTEIPVPSPRDGTVKAILVEESEMVAERQPLVVLEV